MNLFFCQQARKIRFADYDQAVLSKPGKPFQFIGIRFPGALQQQEDQICLPDCFFRPLHTDPFHRI